MARASLAALEIYISEWRHENGASLYGGSLEAFCGYEFEALTKINAKGV